MLCYVPKLYSLSDFCSNFSIRRRECRPSRIFSPFLAVRARGSAHGIDSFYRDLESHRILVGQKCNEKWRLGGKSQIRILMRCLESFEYLSIASVLHQATKTFEYTSDSGVESLRNILWIMRKLSIGQLEECLAL